MRPQYIIIHHSLTEDGETVSWGAIRRYHTQTLGWRDIGYHYGIELVGQYYEILMGRLPGETGAHCKEQGMNRKSLGICCVGNFDMIEPPPGQFQKCLNLVRHLMALYNIPSDRVLGHRELATYKSCPGRSWDMGEFRSLLGG